jgi:hypothetical protein
MCMKLKNARASGTGFVLSRQSVVTHRSFKRRPADAYFVPLLQEPFLRDAPVRRRGKPEGIEERGEVLLDFGVVSRGVRAAEPARGRLVEPEVDEEDDPREFVLLVAHRKGVCLDEFTWESKERRRKAGGWGRGSS